MEEQHQSTNHNEIVTIVAGSDDSAREFDAKKDQLCRESAYFANAFRSQFEEARTLRFVWDDVDPECVNLFHRYLSIPFPLVNPHGYRGVIARHGYVNPWSEYNPGEKTWLDLWMFGDRFKCPGLQNAVIERLHYDIIKRMHSGTEDVYHDGVALDMVNYVYSKTPRGSKLRAYLVEQHVKLSSTPFWNDAMRRKIAGNEDFLFNVLDKFASLRGAPVHVPGSALLIGQWERMNIRMFQEPVEAGARPSAALRHLRMAIARGWGKGF